MKKHISVLTLKNSRPGLVEAMALVGNSLTLPQWALLTDEIFNVTHTATANDMFFTFLRCLRCVNKDCSYVYNTNPKVGIHYTLAGANLTKLNTHKSSFFYHMYNYIYSVKLQNYSL